MNTEPQNISIRFDVIPSDQAAVGDIITSSGFFRDDEIPVAVELVTERLENGPDSGYEFVCLDINGILVSYACFGPIPCTLCSYDLYWIATDGEYRGQGLGTTVLQEVEKAIGKMGGKGIYVETSSLPKYEPTRTFYLKNGYIEKARFEDFYEVGDDKVVYVKKI